MKQYFVLGLCLSVLAACGSKKTGDQAPEVILQNEDHLGLTSVSECARAQEVRGSNFTYRWIKAKHGDLQQFIIHNAEKKVAYDEARADGFLKGEAPYQYTPGSKVIYFNTTTKTLKLTFPQIPLGSIENDPTGQQYMVGVLTYADGSGYFDKFLCEIKQ